MVTMPTWGIVMHHKAKTSRGQQAVVYWGVYAGIRHIPTSGFF